MFVSETVSNLYGGLFEVTLFQQGVENAQFPAAASAISSFSFFEVVEFQFGKQRQV